MKKSTSLIIVLYTALYLTSGCAVVNSSQQTTDTMDPSETAIEQFHTIAPGDRLSDISLKYTRDSSNWQAIADYNGISDPRTLRIGDTLTIPATLITSQNQTPTDSALATAIDAKPSGLSTASSATLALQRAREDLSTQAPADIVIEPITTNRKFQLSPIEPSSLATAPNPQIGPPQIKVIGTYYPKGVYQQPTNFSTLMMRVAPGAVFELEREANGWYRIVTDKGVGYLRTIDGRILKGDKQN